MYRNFLLKNVFVNITSGKKLWHYTMFNFGKFESHEILHDVMQLREQLNLR